MQDKWGPTRLISRDQLERCVDMSDALKTVEEVLRGHAHGRVNMPPKVTMNLADYGLQAWNTAMPAYIEPLGAAGVKWVGGFAQNRERHGLPFLIAVILLQDPATGYPLAIMEGVHLTNLRTGAVAAVAVTHYARRDSHRLGLVGAGAQARFVVDGIKRVIRVDHIRVYDINPEASRQYAKDIEAQHGILVEVCSDARQAVIEADIVITATTSTVPLVKREWFGPGVTAISIGSQGQEFDDDAVLGADKLVCDSWEQCSHLGELRGFAESGRLSRSDIFAEIGQTVAGLRPGRQNDGEYILVVPIGLGSLDIAMAKVAYERLLESGEHLEAFYFFDS